MLSKTNQFNLTTRRHSRAQVQSMLDRSGAIGLALRLRDKFGDQGIVALSIAVPEPEDGALVVDSFLVSCRALGRGVEDALWFALVNRALAKGARKLQTQFFPTAKNGPAAKFYDQLGLPCVERDSSAAYYRLEPIVPYPLPSWIALRNHNHEQ